MPTVTYNSNTYTCATAIKGADFIELRDANGVPTYWFGGITDFSAFTISDGSWATEPGDINLRATSASLTSGNIVLTVDGTIGNSTLVIFTAPCDCASMTGGIVVAGSTYTLVNSVGRAVAGASGVFCGNSPVSVLLDRSSLKAYLLSGPANITWGTADLNAGVSALATGQLYLVYE